MFSEEDTAAFLGDWRLFVLGEDDFAGEWYFLTGDNETFGGTVFLPLLRVVGEDDVVLLILNLPSENSLGDVATGERRGEGR